jgi:hypothetical protein
MWQIQACPIEMAKSAIGTVQTKFLFGICMLKSKLDFQCIRLSANFYNLEL